MGFAAGDSHAIDRKTTAPTRAALFAPDVAAATAAARLARLSRFAPVPRAASAGHCRQPFAVRRKPLLWANSLRAASRWRNCIPASRRLVAGAWAVFTGSLPRRLLHDDGDKTYLQDHGCDLCAQFALCCGETCVPHARRAFDNSSRVEYWRERNPQCSRD